MKDVWVGLIVKIAVGTSGSNSTPLVEVRIDHYQTYINIDAAHDMAHQMLAMCRRARRVQAARIVKKSKDK